MYLPLLLLLLSITPFVICDHEDIITLKNKTHLVCIVDGLTSPIYIDPPLTTTSEPSDFLRQDEFWSDWSIRDSFEIMQEQIMDKRWEDFAVIHTDYISFSNAASASFSIYLPEKIEFYIDDSESLDYYSRVPENPNGKWRHYSVISNNNRVDIYEDGQIFHSISDLTPREIVVKTPGNKYWKTHNYTLAVATVISSFPTNFTVPPDIDCLTFYVSLCSHCSLLVDLGGGNNYTLSGNDRVHNFSVYSGNRTTLIRNTSDQKDGFWQIESWRCPNIISKKAIYEVTLNETNSRSCKTVTNSNEIIVHRHKRSADKISLSGCNIGFFGKSCELSCASILGSSKNSCQGYEICDELECFCAWGYHGSGCSETCSNETWGLGCEHKCPDRCTSCDPITGDRITNLEAASMKLVEHKRPTESPSCNPVTKTSNPMLEAASMRLLIVISILALLLLVAISVSLYFFAKYRQLSKKISVMENGGKLLVE